MTKIKDGRGKGNLKLSLSKFKPTSFYHHCTFCTYFANPIFQNMKSLSRMIYRFLCKNLLLCQYKMCCWESNGRGSKSFDPPRRLSPHNNKFSTVPINHFESKLKWSYSPELRKWVFFSFLFYAELQNVTDMADTYLCENWKVKYWIEGTFYWPKSSKKCTEYVPWNSSRG